MRRVALVALVALPMAAAIPACSSRSPSAAATSSPNTRSLSPAEIDEAMSQNMGNLYQLISSRRSHWLLPTYSAMPNRPSPQVAVWMDNVRLGGAAELNNIPLSLVVAVRYLTPSEAQGALGLNNLGGAIQVTTRRP